MKKKSGKQVKVYRIHACVANTRASMYEIGGGCNIYNTQTWNITKKIAFKLQSV